MPTGVPCSLLPRKRESRSGRGENDVAVRGALHFAPPATHAYMCAVPIYTSHVCPSLYLAGTSTSCAHAFGPRLVGVCRCTRRSADACDRYEDTVVCCTSTCTRLHALRLRVALHESLSIQYMHATIVWLCIPHALCACTCNTSETGASRRCVGPRGVMIHDDTSIITSIYVFSILELRRGWLSRSQHTTSRE